MTINRANARRQLTSQRRKGAIVVLAAFMMVVMIGMLAMSLDVGYICVNRGEIQRAVDAGALAAMGEMMVNVDNAENVAREYVRRNFVGSDPIPNGQIEVQRGVWDSATRTFTADEDNPAAIRVWAEQTNRPLFFGRIFGRDQFSVESEAVARFRPRDIMIVLDYSASMNDDSELKQINKLGRAEVEANLKQIHDELGAPQFGSLPWRPTYLASDDNATIKRTLGLDSIPYPYPRGSWDDYVNYVKSNGNIRRAGYQKYYGGLTLVNYWLERRPGYDETPDLWQTSEQPITAVKDAVATFFAYLDEFQTDDRVGLSVYTSEDGTGKLESGLTIDFAMVERVSRQRQAGHYDRYTNIGAGLQKAREELQANGRGGSQKMIVLMTDGIANRPNGPADAKQYVMDEAQKAKDAGIPVVTVSLGSGADTNLMQAVADLTGGVHFNVPGGSDVSQYEEDLKDVFKQIAGTRPSVLVK